ncbi:MAG TPA: hypothetical protein PKE30_12540 [Niabella sp.]|nr:hypothetical protein [Niabella sp.]
MNNKKAGKLASSCLDSAKQLRKLLSPEDDVVISEKIKANDDKAVEYLMQKQTQQQHYRCNIPYKFKLAKMTKPIIKTYRILIIGLHV